MKILVKKDVFKKELSYIKNQDYKKNAEILIELLPDYFFKVAASSTGKYHPSFSLGAGGLVRHTKAAFKIGYELLENDSIGNIFKQDEKDLMLIGILLHDGLKHGLEESQHTIFEHPLMVSKYIKDNKDKLTLKESEINFICDVISSHMGQWNKDYKGNEVLPKPSNKYQKFVHMCDYLSSKKFLDIKFENNEIVDN